MTVESGCAAAAGEAATAVEKNICTREGGNA
jgi:hypothetical protein